MLDLNGKALVEGDKVVVINKMHSELCHGVVVVTRDKTSEVCYQPSLGPMVFARFKPGQLMKVEEAKTEWNEITLENDSFPPMDVDVLVRKGDEMAVAYRDSYGWEPCGVTSNYDMAEAALDFVPSEWAYIK